MHGALAAAVAAVIARATGTSGRVVSSQSIGGGCINDAKRVDLSDGASYFVKSRRDGREMFDAERLGLETLGAAGVLRTPEVLGQGDDGAGTDFLVLEMVDSGRPGPGFSATFGGALASLHLATRADRYGFESDNFVGATPQPNAWCGDWSTFWGERRLGFQLALGLRNGAVDRELMRLGERLVERLPGLIGEPAEPACLLHGDLWGGNYLVAAAGAAVLVDPAVYYGSREADLAMTTLFGGFDQAFYRGYEETWPLEPGSHVRLDIYKLYHLLNHLNLFGASYRQACKAILERYAG